MLLAAGPISRRFSTFLLLENSSRQFRTTIISPPITAATVGICNDRRTTSGHLRLTHRNFSLQSSIESLARSQSGLFKTLSESAPVECCQNFLLALHDSTGMPWWATIVCATLVLRTAVLPLAIYQTYIAGKVTNLRFELAELSKELRMEVSVAVRRFKWDEDTAKRMYRLSMKKQWKALVVRENCHPAKGVIVAFAQFPLWISVSVALRNLVFMLPHDDIAAHVTWAQLNSDSFAWIPSLLHPDPTFILPVSMGLINLAIIEIQSISRHGEKTKAQKLILNFFRGFCLVTVPLAACLPSCLTLYWVTSSAYGLVQNLTLLSPKIRRFCHVPETKLELERPYSHIRDVFKNKVLFRS